MNRRRWVITLTVTKRGKPAWRVVEVCDAREGRPKFIPSSKNGIVDRTPEGYRQAFEEAVTVARRSASNRGGLVCIEDYPNPGWATGYCSTKALSRSCCKIQAAEDTAACMPELYGDYPATVREAVSRSERIVQCSPACERVPRRRDVDED